MFINKLTSNTVDSIGRVLIRTTTYGKFKGDSIAIDNWRYKGNIIEKRFVMWNDTWQKIVNKQRNKNGKFERIG